MLRLCIYAIREWFSVHEQCGFSLHSQIQNVCADLKTTIPLTIRCFQYLQHPPPFSYRKGPLVCHAAQFLVLSNYFHFSDNENSSLFNDAPNVCPPDDHDSYGSDTDSSIGTPSLTNQLLFRRCPMVHYKNYKNYKRVNKGC